MQEEAFLDERLLAEREELPRDVLMAGAVEGVGDQRAVARPRVRVGVAREFRDVEIGRGDDRAMVVRVDARSQDAPPVQLRDVRAELLPVGSRPAPCV